VKWLTFDGAVAAVAVGGAVAVGLGWRGVTLLLAFFVSGSLLTRLSGGEGGQRNARQVVANGGVAAAAALAGWWAVAAGALAAAAADTWATEIGAFSTRPPRLVTTGATVAPGTSGGITLLGTLGGAAGAVVMGVLAGMLEPRGSAAGAPLAGPGLALGVALAGVLGMLADSLLGATAQGQFECASCGRRFERAATVCHEPVRRIGGLAWLDNDGVNLATTLVGALAALAWRCWA
jgi:uncharacterized protein (TIGR00297 family)